MPQLRVTIPKVTVLLNVPFEHAASVNRECVIEMARSCLSGGHTGRAVNTITVDGSEDPPEWTEMFTDEEAFEEDNQPLISIDIEDDGFDLLEQESKDAKEATAILGLEVLDPFGDGSAFTITTTIPRSLSGKAGMLMGKELHDLAERFGKIMEEAEKEQTDG